MKESEKIVEETQGVETQAVEVKEAKFSGSVACKSIMTNVGKLNRNGLMDDMDLVRLQEIMTKVGLKIMGL